MALDIGVDNPALFEVEESPEKINKNRQKVIIASPEYREIEEYVYATLERVGNTPVNVSFVKKYLSLWVVLELTLPSNVEDFSLDITQAPKIKTILSIMDDLGKKLELNKLGVLGALNDDEDY